LHDGDIVDIITSSQSHPVSQWLDFTVSSKAKSQIGIEIKRLSGDRARIIEKGKKMLFDTFEDAGIKLNENLSNFTSYYGSTLDEKKAQELYYHIGQNIRKPSSFLPRRQKIEKPHTQKEKIPTRIMIGGEKQIPHQVAQCCHPEYPEDIVAVLRTGGKCMIHSVRCASLTRVNPMRLLPAYWQTGEKGKVISFSLLFHGVP
jgi:(p)ppGpp synthase/HD superfamily hydrolase